VLKKEKLKLADEANVMKELQSQRLILCKAKSCLYGQ
jgi:hypothetical protein